MLSSLPYKLYVPSFPFQLLLVGRLTNSFNCDAIFFPSSFDVVFQDRLIRKNIGEGVYSNGLYFLHHFPNNSKGLQVNSLKNRVLWHRSLRHPSESILSSLFSALVWFSRQIVLAHPNKMGWQRKNRYLLEKMRLPMLQMNVPMKLWSHGVLMAAYVINRLPS